MSYKHTLTKLGLAAAGLFGMERMVSNEEAPVAIVKPSEEISEEPTRDSSSLEKTQDEQVDEAHATPETDMARAAREIEDLPKQLDLPILKGLPEKPPEVAERPKINPYLKLDNAKAYVVDLFSKLHLKCTDRRRHSGLDEDIPSDIFGLTSENTGTEENPAFNVNIDTISDEEWASFLALVFHPENETVEMIPDPDVQAFIPPIVVAGDLMELQDKLKQYIERINLARAYALAGMTQEEIKRRLEAQEKKSEKTEEPAVLAKN